MKDCGMNSQDEGLFICCVQESYHVCIWKVELLQKN